MRFNEQKQVAIPLSMLDSLGYTVEEKAQFEGIKINRNIDSDNNISMRFSLGTRGEWTITVDGNLLEDVPRVMMEKLLEYALKSIRDSWSDIEDVEDVEEENDEE